MKVKDLLTDESKWTQGAFARNSEGYSVHINSCFASCWCLLGAIELCYPSTYPGVANAVVDAVGGCDIHRWNDDPKRTFAEVRELIERLDI